MLGFNQEKRDEIVQISKKFGVLSNFTALIQKIKVQTNSNGIQLFDSRPLSS